MTSNTFPKSGVFLSKRKDMGSMIMNAVILEYLDSERSFPCPLTAVLYIYWYIMIEIITMPLKILMALKSSQG